MKLRLRPLHFLISQQDTVIIDLHQNQIYPLQRKVKKIDNRHFHQHFIWLEAVILCSDNDNDNRPLRRKP